MINYNAIDLDLVKDNVAYYCSIEDAKRMIKEEEIIFNPLVIKNNLELSKEAFVLLKNNFNLSFDGIENNNDLFTKASKDIPLSSYELAKVLAFLNHCGRIKSKLNTLNDESIIKGYGDSIFIDDRLAKEIDKVVDINGNIKDDASPKLKEINNAINRNLNNIHSASASFLKDNASSLQETSVFSRNDRVAFLLKNSYKNKFNGYQYGTSSSGLATYVEPQEFVELNNKAISLENDRQEEINRILKELTYLVSKNAELYILNFDSLVKLDVIFAKGEYGFYNNACIPNFNNDNSLSLIDVAHPLIEANKCVVNTYNLKEPYKGIVISGTNTGGKTVGLKLIGLSVLMTYLGIPVIAKEAYIPFFNNIYIDIDDNQSISNALSTFSAHISNINEILNKANDESLILIDELISGTDPKEAQAISLAILNKILEIGSKFVITTHYDDIKEFAYSNPNILLSSVGFDLDNLRPTYKYIEDSVGVSNAIDIASRYLFDQSIIAEARDYLNINKSKQDELLDKLGKQIAENELLKEELDKEIKSNESLNKELENKLKSFEAEKKLLKDKYIEKLNEYIEDIKDKANEKLDSLKDVKDRKQVLQELDELIIEEENVKEDVSFNIGDRVRIASSSGVGDIVDIKNDKVSVSVNGLIIKTTLDNLEKLKKQTKKEYKPKQRMARVSREINLVGQRVEDGLALLDSYLDNAYGSGLKEVKVIHGFGTGQLRKAIREHLKHNKTVASFDNGGEYDGGSNVTIVKFK